MSQDGSAPRTKPQSVDAFLRDGCGRCAYYQTPSCKVNPWREVLVALRALLQESGLVEELKWSAPCYTLGGKNVVMLSALKEHATLSFFKGAALVDEQRLLTSPGPSSRYARYLAVRSLDELGERRAAIEALVAQAIELERAGKKVDAAPASEPIPEELARALAKDPRLVRAFEALTPGRRRSHVLFVSGAKQTETRARRVERCVPMILAGRGQQER